MTDPLLQISSLTIAHRDSKKEQNLIQQLHLTLHKKEVLAVVGESGSGKTISSLSTMGLLPKPLQNIPSGEVMLNGEPLEIRSPELPVWQSIRGKRIAMIFQDPMSSLNPSMTVGKQVVEMMSTHQIHPTDQSRKKATIDWFRKVEIPHPETAFEKYPHEMSGGQKQRVMIAMAMAANPELIIADEPTTALDVTVQKSILDLLKNLINQQGLSLIFISHDLDVVKNFADRIMVMLKGEVVEEGTVDQVINHPKHAYTKALIACKPPIQSRPYPLPTVADLTAEDLKSTKATEELKDNLSTEVILKVNDLQKRYTTSTNWLGKPTAHFTAVNGISFQLFKGETLGLVGESGCGKSTVGKLLTGLLIGDAGEILFKEQPLKPNRTKEERRWVQMIFQDPFSSLNPRITAGESIVEVMKVHGIQHTSHKDATVKLLEEVGLSASDFSKYPHQFSGGQRQRLVIARTLAMEPEVIICDESVSALDVSVQAQVLNLLNQLKMERNLSYVFISHDLSVVRYMSDRIMVMKEGSIVEKGSRDDLFLRPQHTYTKKLLSSIMD
ncbi:MAG: ABC transporter ATP-binding protein [Bacteroidota bacterium]